MRTDRALAGDVARDWSWSDRFIPAITRAVGPYLLVPAPMDLDAREATDLLVFMARDQRVAARIRRHEHLGRYGDEFTIRSRRSSGNVTEYAKIVEGWGDLFFYGFAAPGGDDLVAWRLMDLAVFRAEHIRAGARGRRLWKERANRDGKTGFAFLRVADFPPALVVAEFGHRPIVAPTPAPRLSGPPRPPQLGLFTGR